MGVIDRIKDVFGFNGIKNYSLSDFERDFERYFYGGFDTKTGITINEETALRFSAVFACVRILSETLAVMPIKVFKRRYGGQGKDVAYEHPLYRILHDSPSREMTAFNFKETMQNHLVTTGNAYAYKEIDSRGRVKSLTMLNPHAVTPQRNKKGRLEYLFKNNEIEKIYNFDEILHISGLGFDGIVGYSPVRMAMDTIGLGIAAEHFASYFYSNGANVGGFIELPGTIKDKAALKKEFENKFSGLNKSHKVLFLEEGMKFQKLVMPLNEAQFIETRKFQIQEIARIYRVPLHLLQDLERATFSNIEHQDLGFIKHTMLPWVSRWEAAINHRLFTEQEKKEGYFVDFNMDEILRGDSKTRAEVLHIKRQDGIISANEWRELDGQNPQNGDFGDEYFINGNMINVKNVPEGGESDGNNRTNIDFENESI